MSARILLAVVHFASTERTMSLVTRERRVTEGARGQDLSGGSGSASWPAVRACGADRVRER